MSSVQSGVVSDPPAAASSYARRLTLFDGVMVVIGGVIGSGIFLTPAVVAERTGTTALFLGAWVVGGMITVAGALCFGELGSRRPEAGGGYLYLREAFGPLPAFLYGWTLLAIINTGAVAAVAIAFASYAVQLGSGSEALVRPVAVGAILLLTAANYLGVRAGSTVQNIFTVLKLAALAGLIVVALAWALGDAGAPPAATGAAAGGAVLGTALIPVLFSYGGWQHANHLAGEILAPRRNLPRALLLGVGAVVAAYLLVNLAYVGTLGMGGLAASTVPAADTMRVVLGEEGATLITLGIALSTFGILNLLVMAAPRVYQAMAADGLFFASAAALHPRYRTPARALAIQGAWAVTLTLTGSYAQLLDYVVFGDWIFFALAAATLFVYRARERHEPPAGQEPAFRVPWYPWPLVLYLLASLLVVASSVASNPGNALAGALLIAAGVPAYLYWRRRG